MRLICPECAAQYEIADGLIPPEGRDVECSACGHGWRQPGAPTLVLTAEAAVDDDFEAEDDLPPPASRKLPDPVFAILREEAERELSARAADRAGGRDPLDGDATATWRRPGNSDALPDPHALAASLQWEVPRRPEPEPETIPPQPAEAIPQKPPVPAAALRPPVVTEAAAVTLRQRRAHDRGFAVAMLLAALLVGAYAAAPSLADRGEVGARLMEARETADRGRLWLQAHAESLTDNAIAGTRGLFD